MNRIVVLACLVCGPFRLALSACSANVAERPRSVLDGVKALEKPVTDTETRIPLGILVQKVADEPVAVVVKAFSDRELLVQLADLLEYTWSRRGKAGAWCYEIYQDLGGQ